jgi:DNA polymerase I-like protein with 3'-5' exonuclease and polymerase domains
MTTKNYGAIQDTDSLKTYVTKLLDEGKVFSFDIETGYDGPNIVGVSTLPFHPQFKVVGISFTNDPEWARYVPIAHDNGQNVNKVAVARLFWNLLNTGLGIPHNAMFELQGMGKFFRETLWDDPFFGTAVRKSHGYFPVFSDTMIEANMMQCYQPLGAGGGVGVGLKGLTYHIFGHKMTEFKDLFPEEDSEMGPGTAKKDLKYIRFNTREICPRVVEYACEDSAWTLSLHLKHYPEVSGTLMFRTEILLLNVLVEMELHGMELDWAAYERRAIEVASFISEMNEEIQEYFSDRLGELVSVNLGSPKQVAELLYEKLGLPVQLDPKTKRPTTGEKAITVLERQDAGVRRISRYREVSKLQSSYLTKYLKELAYAEDGRAHPNHNQLGAGTGRFSVDHVSYQQWPKPYHLKLESGRTLDLNYRNFLIAPEGFRIIGFDFSQVELRILAGMTNETDMLKAFADGIDIHVATASAMLGIPISEVTKKERAKGKTLNFGIVYGLGVDALAETLGISIDEAEALLQQYFEGFPKLRAWMDDRVIEGNNNWEVSTLFGRRFHIWEYDEYERLMNKARKMEDPEERRKTERWARRMRSKADRMCVNAPVQGGAADYIKLGMVRAQRKIKEMGWEGKVIMVMTIHDALEFYVHESISTQEVIDALNPCVSFPVQGLPEILAEWHEGTHWGDVVEIKVDKQKQIIGYAWEDEDGEKHEFDTLDEAYAYQAQYEYGGAKEEPEPEKEKIEYCIYFAEPPTFEEWEKAKEVLADCVSDTGIPVSVLIEGKTKTLENLYSITSTPMDMIQSYLSTGTIELRKVEA